MLILLIFKGYLAVGYFGAVGGLGVVSAMASIYQTDQLGKLRSDLDAANTKITGLENSVTSICEKVILITYIYNRKRNNYIYYILTLIKRILYVIGQRYDFGNIKWCDTAQKVGSRDRPDMLVIFFRIVMCNDWNV